MVRHIETDKDTEIYYFNLYPGSSGSGVITPGAAPATVFLDPEFTDDDVQRGRHHPRLTYSSSPVLKDHYGGRFWEAREKALEAVSIPNNARYFEHMLAELFQHEVDIKHILTGVTTFSGEHYHDFGFLEPALNQ